MTRWRRTVKHKLVSDAWVLKLECGHEAYRSARHSKEELPVRVLCHACNSLIGSRIKSPSGKVGVISSYEKGRFGIAWQNDGVTRSTLDQLRDTLEIL
jgi:hypothetical protein